VKRLVPLAGFFALLALLVWLASGTEHESSAERSLPATAPVADREAVRAESDATPSELTAMAPSDLGSARPAVPAPLLIGGLVVRASDGTPLDGVKVIPVLADPPDGSARLSAIETRDGRFELGPDAVKAGVRSLWCVWTELTDSDLGDFHSLMPTGRQVTLDFELAQATTPRDALRIELDTGWLARGTLRDVNGRPLESVHVQTAYGGPDAWSKADGSFVVHDLPRERPRVGFVAHRKGYVDERLSLDTPASPAWEATLDIVLQRAP
jgi:hypothetical protein